MHFKLLIWISQILTQVNYFQKMKIIPPTYRKKIHYTCQNLERLKKKIKAAWIKTPSPVDIGRSSTYLANIFDNGVYISDERRKVAYYGEILYELHLLSYTDTQYKTGVHVLYIEAKYILFVSDTTGAYM